MQYTIISRDEFIKLIKFGSIYHNINYVISEENKDKKLEKLLKILPYDDEIGFLIVSFTYEIHESFFDIKTLIELNIKNIFDIYCLTNTSLEFYKTKFDPLIQFKLYPNEKMIEEIKINKIIEDKQKGAKILFEIFNCDISKYQEKYNAIYIKDLLYYKENGYLNQEFKDFYFDLFCYERKNNFFKDDIGFICDLRSIIKLQDRQEIAIFLSGNLQKLIKDEDQNKKNKNIYELVIETIESPKLSVDQVKRNNFIVGAIFLKLQRLLNTEEREYDYWEKTIELITEFKKTFPEQVEITLFYLGIFLGYKYLYEDYYKHLGLNIYQDTSDNKSNNSTYCIVENIELINTTASVECEVKISNDAKHTCSKKEGKSIDLKSLYIDSLIDIYYRKDMKKRKIKDLKQQYTNENKDVLINLIIQDNLKLEEV